MLQYVVWQQGLQIRNPDPLWICDLTYLEFSFSLSYVQCSPVRLTDFSLFDQSCFCSLQVVSPRWLLKVWQAEPLVMAQSPSAPWCPTLRRIWWWWPPRITVSNQGPALDFVNGLMTAPVTAWTKLRAHRMSNSVVSWADITNTPHPRQCGQPRLLALPALCPMGKWGARSPRPLWSRPRWGAEPAGLMAVLMPLLL